MLSYQTHEGEQLGLCRGSSSFFSWLLCLEPNRHVESDIAEAARPNPILHLEGLTAFNPFAR